MNTDIMNLVDELGDLNARLAQFDELDKRRSELKKILAEHCDTLGDTEETLQGKRFSVVFSKPTTNRTIENIGGFLEAVGLADFLASVKVSTTSAAKLLSKTQAAELFVESRGSRRMKAVVEVVQATRPAPEQIAVESFYASLAGIIQGVAPRVQGH